MQLSIPSSLVPLIITSSAAYRDLSDHAKPPHTIARLAAQTKAEYYAPSQAPEDTQTATDRKPGAWILKIDRLEISQ